MRFTIPVGIILSSLVLGVWAQQGGVSNGTTRAITLDESVQLALEQNLQIALERWTPKIVGYELQGAYGSYDPSWQTRYTHASYSSEGGLIPGTSETFDNSKQEGDEVESRLAGRLPTGMSYDLSGNISDTLATRGEDPSEQIARGSATVSLTQPLLKDFWIDQARLTIKLRKKELQIGELGYMFKVMEVIEQVELAYYQLIFSRTNIVVQEDALRLAERLLFEVRKKVEVGTLAPLEEKRVEAEVERARSALIEARYGATLRENILKGLITDKYQEWHGQQLAPAETLQAKPRVYNLGESWMEALSRRPDYQQQLMELEMALVTLKYSRNQLFPRLDAFGSYGHTAVDQRLTSGRLGGAMTDLMRGNNPQHSYGLQMSVPLSLRRERYAYKTAKAQQEQQKVLLQQAQQRILIEVDDAVNKCKAAFEKASATRQARLFAEAALDAEQKKFENGKSTSYTVLQFQQDLTVARYSEIEALAQYNQALAELDFRQGRTLERHRITLTVEE